MIDLLDSQACLKLTEEECTTYIARVMKEVRDEDDLADALLNLSLYTSGKCLVNYYPELIERELFYPSAIYKHAGDAVAEQLIQLIPLQEDDVVSIGMLLSCLAWIGTDRVVAYFNEVAELHPAWTEELFIHVLDYTLDAGWCIEDGKRRNLYNAPDDKEKLSHFVECSDTCPICSSNFTLMFSAKPLPTAPVTPFKTCLMCSCYYPVFMKLSDGESHWHSKNEPKQYEELDIVNSAPIQNALDMTTDLTPVPDQSLNFPEREHTQLGGYPTWIQDAEYLTCPDCGKKMNYVAQINFSEYMTYGEGIYYFHYCDSCKVTGSNFQQA